ncbi:MAG: DUF4198 domain-containing protein [Pseudomonadota bacterium]
MTICSEWMRVAAILGLCLAANAPGHDFMLWPGDAAPKRAGTPVSVRFAVGHDGDYDPWPHGLTKLTRLDWVSPDGSMRDLVASARKADVSVRPESPGSHMLLLESSPSRSELEAERFDAYVAKEGLAAIAEHRRTVGASGPGRERYSRRAKALVQVGDRIDAEIVSADYGMTLELVPLAHPMTLAPGARLPVEVRYRGKPLPGALVTLESLSQPAVSKSAAVSDADGRVAFVVAPVADWKLNVVWGVPANVGGHYETLFSSLTFGYRAPGTD